MASKPNERAAKAAALRAEQARREARRRILTIGAVALAMILIVGGAIAFSVVKNNHDNKKIGQRAAIATSGYGASIGPETAAHSVVIYEDFLCPYCGELERGSETELATLADAGKVHVEYRPFNLLGGSDMNSYSVRAAGAFSIVLKTSGNAVAIKFHNLLYQNQPSEQGPYLSDADLVKYAVEAGAKESAVKSKIESHAGQAWVGTATQKAFATGLKGTPTIVVDGTVISGTSADALLSAVQ